jgi:Fe2+ or Zn2+ uptake regulation protein
MTAFEILQKHHDYIQKNGEKPSEYEEYRILAAMEEYAALRIHDVVGRSEQLFCECERNNPYTGVKFDFDLRCITCNRIIEQNNCH